MSKSKKCFQYMILNKRISYTIIVLFSLTFVSCSGFDRGNKNGFYFIETVDTTFFVKYNSIFVSDNNGIKWILSDKIPDETNDFILLNGYKKIKRNTFVKLDLIKIDTLKIIESNVKPHRTSKIEYTFDDKLVVWKNDTIKYDVFFSPQLYGLYTRLNK